MSAPRYHYTVGVRWTAIRRAGLLVPATAGLAPTERPAVWASTRADWEPTANKLGAFPDGTTRPLTREETWAHGGGAVRLLLRPEDVPLHWWAFRRSSGISAKRARGLLDAARSLAADPDDWWTGYDPIPADRWLRVDRRDPVSGLWEPVTLALQ